MINHFASQSQTCHLLINIFYIESNLWKVVQFQVEQMRINFLFEANIYQVQIITYIIYSSIMEMLLVTVLTYFSMSHKTS